MGDDIDDEYFDFSNSGEGEIKPDLVDSEGLSAPSGFQINDGDATLDVADNDAILGGGGGKRKGGADGDGQDDQKKKKKKKKKEKPRSQVRRDRRRSEATSWEWEDCGSTNEAERRSLSLNAQALSSLQNSNTARFARRSNPTNNF